MKRLISLVATLIAGLALTAVPASAAPTDVVVRAEVLTTDTSDAISLQVAPDGRIIWGEREGQLNVLTPEGEQFKSERLHVSTDACTAPGGSTFPATLVPQPVRDVL